MLPSKRPAGRPRKVDGPKKRRARMRSWGDDNDDEGDADFEAESGSDSDEPKPKRKRGRPKLVEGRKKTKQPEPQLENKHHARRQLYETDSERLLLEVRDLAQQEKKTQEKLIEKLKKDVKTLSQRMDEERERRDRDVDRIVADRMRELDAKQSSTSDADAEKVALKEHIKELEAQFASFKRSTGPNDVVTVNAAAASAAAAMQNSEAVLQLNQANKLLEVYRLVTSTDIRLIQSVDEDDQEGDDCTEIVCTTKDSATGNQFEFELAVPAIASSEIDYLPSEKPSTGVKVPSYLREELSFSRSEMTKFIRSVLDVVIRKKKA